VEKIAAYLKKGLNKNLSRERAKGKGRKKETGG
jgi:hypothetical protein